MSGRPIVKGFSFFDAKYPIMLGVGAAAGLSYLYRHNPHLPGDLPGCILLNVTGLYCPGCGATRTVYDLMHLDFLSAISMNVYTLLVLPLVVVSWAIWLFRSGRGLPPRRTVVPNWALRTLLVSIMGFWLLRNIPMFSWLAPGGEIAPTVARFFT